MFVVDGAGGYQHAPRSIASAIDELQLSLYVRSFDWTHGRGRGLADMLDLAYSCRQGQLLADEVCRTRSQYPGLPVYLVAFSAGSGVALAAASRLPPDTLERIVLLAPAVSAGYDLRGALASARQGLDAFTSENDRGWLGLGTGIIGTADGTRDAAAGRVGFRPPVLAPCEAWLASRLRQHPWDARAAWTGNDGGHAASLSPEYLKLYVLPLLQPTGAPAPVLVRAP